jgi:hypothetical protein
MQAEAYAVPQAAVSNLLAELLDAYEALSDDQTSEVFETAAGYHIVKRMPVPAESFAWFRRITIAYAPVTIWLRSGRSVTRSRAEARQLADELQQRLRASPEEFSALVAKYSDDVAAEVDGDAGPQSNLEGALNVATRLTVARLKMLEISEVQDELGGYTILQRVPDKAIEPRAFDAFVVPFEGAQVPVETPRTEGEARKLAAELARSLAARPAEFPAARAHFCAETRCLSDGVVVTDGSTYPMIYRQLAELAVGEVSTRIETGSTGMLVFQRVAVPAKAAAATRRFELRSILGSL